MIHMQASGETMHQLQRLIRISVIIVGVLSILAMLSGCGINNWQRRDQVLYGTYAAGQIVDVFQTREILSNPEFEELNPLIQCEKTLYAVKAVSMILTYLLADYFEDHRSLILGASNAVTWGVVIRNRSIGVRIPF